MHRPERIYGTEIALAGFPPQATVAKKLAKGRWAIGEQLVEFAGSSLKCRSISNDIGQTLIESVFGIPMNSVGYAVSCAAESCAAAGKTDEYAFATDKR